MAEGFWIDNGIENTPQVFNSLGKLSTCLADANVPPVNCLMAN
jgi:hypothetical protein